MCKSCVIILVRLTFQKIMFNTHVPSILKKDIIFYVINDHVEKGNIALEFVCTDYQIPNILTKPIACKWFEKLRVALGLIFGN